MFRSFIIILFLLFYSLTIGQAPAQQTQQPNQAAKEWHEKNPLYEMHVYNRVKSINKRTVRTQRLLIFGFLIMGGLIGFLGFQVAKLTRAQAGAINTGADPLVATEPEPEPMAAEPEPIQPEPVKSGPYTDEDIIKTDPINRQSRSVNTSLMVVTTVLLTLVAIEAMGQIFIYVSKGKPGWSLLSQEQFNVRGFTKLVNDHRFVTTIPGYTSNKYSFDEYGFRKGNNHPKVDGKNIVFAGDSVPFGWGIEGTSTVPSKFQELLVARGDDRGVINAAIPSYSLNQTVWRYKLDVAQKFNVDTVILQIYDPASIFPVLGSKWRNDINWTTLKKYKYSNVFNDFYLRYSSLYYFCVQTICKGNLRTDLSDWRSDEGIKAYRTGIRDSLKQFENLIAGKVRRVLILPVTRPPGKRGTYPPINILNYELRTFAETLPNGIFVDTLALFDSNAEKYFIDACCHLSEAGAEKQAGYLLNFVLKE